MDLIADSLTVQARALWAKTGRDEQSHLWEPLYVHMIDAAHIARLIWNKWLAEPSRRFISDGIGVSEDECGKLVSWIAGMHDIGKATPSFQTKAPHLADSLRSAGLRVPAKCESVSHAYSGELIVKEWLVSHAWDESSAAQLASVIGSHHGSTPTEEKIREIYGHQAINPDEVLGDSHWSEMRCQILEWLTRETGMDVVSKPLKAQTVSPYVLVQLTGLVIMADWISSNTDLFPLVEEVASWNVGAARASAAWEKLDLPSFSTSENVDVEGMEELFHRRFPSIPEEAALRPVQREAIDSMAGQQEPSLTIIEAPMGCGKTEASLLGAEILLKKYGGSGLAYLLPTQATTNAMFERVRSWLSSLLEDQGEGAWTDLHLLHGKARLNERFAVLPTWHASWMGDDGSKTGEGVIAHQWFSGRKRGLLSPFVVGTVDQLLMSVLNTRHAQLRHFGLLGKVVVIDEVHAYDAYTNVYLDRALAYLGSYGIPVLLLSATLPPERRTALINAYQGKDRKRARRKKVSVTPPRLSSGDSAYPLITVCSSRSGSLPSIRACQSDERTQCISIEYLEDEDQALVNELRAALSGGGCVCVLRDTVSRAQRTYELLKDELSVPVRLVHARFLAIDRARNDEELVDLLGPNQDKRPKALVLVATSVVEQSLDLDFDLLITDIAPVDLLLQRMGRLHRHVRGEGERLRPELLRRPRCVITGVQDNGLQPPEFSKGIASIYQPAILMRTLCALSERMGEDGCVSLPSDIAPLVESVYGESGGLIPEGWLAAYREAERRLTEATEAKRNAASQWLLPKPGPITLDGWMRHQVSIDGERIGRAAVRDIEDAIEVVLITADESGYRLLPWVAQMQGVDPHLGDGIEVPPDEVARVAALCTVNLPPSMSAPYRSSAVIRALESFGAFDGWQESKWLSGMLPLVVDDHGEAMVACDDIEFCLRYEIDKGLMIVSERRR